jgi:hypothetical protein
MTKRTLSFDLGSKFSEKKRGKNQNRIKFEGKYYFKFLKENFVSKKQKLLTFLLKNAVFFEIWGPIQANIYNILLIIYCFRSCPNLHIKLKPI